MVLMMVMVVVISTVLLGCCALECGGLGWRKQTLDSRRQTVPWLLSWVLKGGDCL